MSGNLISLVMAGKLAPPGKEGVALSFLATGLTLSTVLGAPAGTYITPLNMLVLNKAGEAADLASSLNISAFHLGNALGAAIGGAAVQTGFVLRGAPAAGAGISAVGLVLLLIIVREEKNKTDIR